MGIEPVYRMIEFCRNPQTLWGKLREGRWDWLGVHPSGQFVLGRPRRSGGFAGFAAAAVLRQGAPEGVHGVRVFADPEHENIASSDWFHAPELARAAFSEQLAEYEAKEGPLLVRVELVVDGATEDERWVVNAPPTYGVWRAPPGD